jgi:hypothetical protein
MGVVRIRQPPDVDDVLNAGRLGGTCELPGAFSLNLDVAAAAAHAVDQVERRVHAVEGGRQALRFDCGARTGIHAWQPGPSRQALGFASQRAQRQFCHRRISRLAIIHLPGYQHPVSVTMSVRPPQRRGFHIRRPVSASAPHHALPSTRAAATRRISINRNA